MRLEPRSLCISRYGRDIGTGILFLNLLVLPALWSLGWPCAWEPCVSTSVVDEQLRVRGLGPGPVLNFLGEQRGSPQVEGLGGLIRLGLLLFHHRGQPVPLVSLYYHLWHPPFNQLPVPACSCTFCCDSRRSQSHRTLGA